MRRKANDPSIDKVLEPLWSAAERVGRNNLLNGVYVSTILLAATPKRLTHSLGRSWRGWLLVDTSGTEPVYRVNRSSTDKASELWLQSAADTEVTVYIF